MKIRPAFEDSSIPTKPQLHTRKHHNDNTYNGARSLPLFTWVRPVPVHAPPRMHTSTQSPRSTRGSNLKNSSRSARARASGNSKSNLSAAPSSSSRSSSATPEPTYEIKLYYPHNRSCTIYRTFEDFLRLRKGLSSSRYKALSSSSSTTGNGNGNGNGICPERHSHNSTCLHKFLKYVMERCPMGITGVGKEMEPAIEFFLRRRIDDCGGGGGGCGSLPT